MSVDLSKFLVKAKINTYASSRESGERILADGSKEFEFKEGEFKYRDRYFGYNPFIGQEIVWQNEKVIWGINYYGNVVSEIISAKDIYQFRGPNNYKKGDHCCFAIIQKIMKKYYTQTTYETCLACCLLFLVNKIKGIKIHPKIELACIVHSLKFSKEDFGIGHFDFILKKFDVSITRILDNKSPLSRLKKMNNLPNLKTKSKRIDIVLLDQYLEKYPILYLDAYYLFKKIHYPHFVTILRKEEKGRESKYRIYDPWDGKEKLIKSKTLSKAILSLRNYLKMVPEMILVQALEEN